MDEDDEPHVQLLVLEQLDGPSLIYSNGFWSC